MKTTTLVCFVTAMAVAAPAAANMRGPRVVEQSPSSALYKPKDADLVVTREDLTFTCGAAKSCQIVAEYHIRADAAVTVELAFVTPGQVTIQAQVGDAKADVKTVDARPIPDDTLHAWGFGIRRDELHEARFQAALTEGQNIIRVEYVQPIALVETGYGYFWDGEFVDTWVYESWPLQEWKRSEDFTLNLTVSTPRAKPSWWARNIGNYTEVACSMWPTEFKPTRKDEGGRLWLTGTLTEVPDRIHCTRGSDEYVSD